jgi:2-polyprenyl-3-methyl-5-hydroxy-6-metoxy-1,4-benzoquinol methylase
MMMSFKKLPIWKNVQGSPGITDFADFSLNYNCRGFIQQNTSGKILKKVYSSYAKDEYNFITQPPGASSWANRLGDERVDFIKWVCGPLEGNVVLEIGAGSLYIAERLMDETGIDEYLIMDPAIKHTTKNSKIHVFREYFENTSCIDKKVNVVICLSCLEHVQDPFTFLIHIRNLLKLSNGKAVFVLPDIKQQFDDGDFNAILHEHLNYFTEETATHLLNSCGLKVLICKTGFDTLKFLVELHETEYVDVEQGAKQPGDIFIKEEKQFNQNLKNLRKYLIECLSLNKTVAFYGANNGLNNVIALANLPHTSNLWIFDNDEAKTAKYIPVCQNPIRHSTDAYCASMSEIFIATNTFFEEAAAFLKSYHGFDASNIRRIFPFEKD